MNVVFHVDLDDPQIFHIALANVINYLNAIPLDSSRIAIVVNGPAAKLLKAGLPDEDVAKIREMMKKGVSIRVCSNALRAFEIDIAHLPPGIDVVPGGINELVRLQQEGWAYIKP